jgi:hypothetical protein
MLLDIFMEEVCTYCMYICYCTIVHKIHVVLYLYSVWIIVCILHVDTYNSVEGNCITSSFDITRPNKRGPAGVKNRHFSSSKIENYNIRQLHSHACLLE